MELKKCAKGHYYDASIHAECPRCKAENGPQSHTMPFRDMPDTPGWNMGDSEKTLPLDPNILAGGTLGPAGESETRPLNSDTLPLSQFPMKPGKEEVRTIPVVQYELKMDPVVGWLVAVSGPEKGRDYRIHSDNNYIGREDSMDICLRGDEAISRERHASVSYDTRERLFYFAPGSGRSIVRVNGKAVLTMIELMAYDEIEIGRTKLVFIPLCGERFEWNNDNE